VCKAINIYFVLAIVSDNFLVSFSLQIIVSTIFIEEDVPYEIVQLPRSFSLHVRNDIPLSRGLGSSAAAIVGGMVLANVLFDYNLCKDALMDYILELENHPDNVGASLMGGLIAGFVRTDQERSQPQDNALKRFKCGYARWQWNTSIRAVCVIPDFTLSTKKARQVLPTHYTRADCVFNLQRLAVLVPALTAPQLDPELVHDILTDRLHQDYRKTLIPGLSQVLSDMTPRRVPGLLGVVLSGAGPTVSSHGY
jgi:homoserine kinase